MQLDSSRAANQSITTLRHLTKQNKQIKPLPEPVIDIGRGFEHRVANPEVMNPLKSAQSTLCYPRMGQRMGQPHSLRL